MRDIYGNFQLIYDETTAKKVGTAASGAHFTHNMIHMLANDLPSTNSCYNTPSNYLHLQHQV